MNLKKLCMVLISLALVFTMAGAVSADNTVVNQDVIPGDNYDAMGDTKYYESTVTYYVPENSFTLSYPADITLEKQSDGSISSVENISIISATFGDDNIRLAVSIQLDGDRNQMYETFGESGIKYTIIKSSTKEGLVNGDGPSYDWDSGSWAILGKLSETDFDNGNSNTTWLKFTLTDGQTLEKGITYTDSITFMVHMADADNTLWTEDFISPIHGLI